MCLYLSFKKKKNKMPKPKICFAAIFKNESKNVYRCLNAIKSIIDYVSICDTGSTDKTVELINQWGSENSIPTKVHTGSSQVFKNFGHNRTLSYKKAIESFPSADYLLLIDADMVVKIKETFDANSLTKDCYLFEQVTPGLRYWNTRLISTRCKWECVGVTHEYWDRRDPKDKNSSPVKFTDIYIEDIGDGGSKQDKFKRDIRLLTDGINDQETPEYLKGRYKFYLANSHKDSGNYADAIEWYQKKIDQQGWVEEIFYSYLNMGKCYLKLKDYSKAGESFLYAWDLHPTRAESLYELSKMYRELGKNNIAMLYAEKGSRIPYPVNDSLFIDHNVYEYLFYEEISIAGFYATEGRQKGKAAMIKLLSMKSKIPDNKYKLAISNAKHYGITEDTINKLTN